MEESYPKQVENNVGKGEIARYEQFLLFPQCFQKACFPGASKGVIVLEWVNGSFQSEANFFTLLLTVVYQDQPSVLSKISFLQP